MYPADFPSDPPPPLIDPTLLVALILAVIVLMAVAFAAGRAAERRSRNDRAPDTPKTIHKAILLKAREAAAAPTGRVIEAAQELVAEILRRLGPVIAVGAPAGLGLKGLMDALKGEPEKHKDKPGKDHHGARHVSHDGNDGHDDDEHEEGELALLGTTLLAPTINIKTKGPIILASTHGDKKVKKPGGDHDEPLPPTYDEQLWRVRKAITTFADHWSRGETLAELQRAQKALLETPDLPKHIPSDH